MILVLYYVRIVKVNWACHHPPVWLFAWYLTQAWLCSRRFLDFWVRLHLNCVISCWSSLSFLWLYCVLLYRFVWSHILGLVYCAYIWQLFTLLMLFAYGKLRCTILRSLKTVWICSAVLLFLIWSCDFSSVISWKYWLLNVHYLKQMVIQIDTIAAAIWLIWWLTCINYLFLAFVFKNSANWVK